MAGVDVAYFLVHMLGSGPDYAAREEVAAARFAAAASEAGVGRVIYLGGLGPDEGGSPHLDSRHRTAEALRELGPPLTYFRAAMIVGPGSESYELLRSIAGKLPALPEPDWLRSATQPIGIRDVVSYLRDAPRVPESAGREIQIGGPDVMQHLDVIARFSQETGRRAALRIPLPDGIASPDVVAAGAAGGHLGLARRRRRAQPRAARRHERRRSIRGAPVRDPARAAQRGDPARPGRGRGPQRWVTSIAQSIEIDAPIERVWDLVMDPERLGDWVTIHRSVAEVPDGELTTGSRFRQEMRLKGIPLKVRWEVVECRPPRARPLAGQGGGRGRGADLLRAERGRHRDQVRLRERVRAAGRQGRQARRPRLQCDLRAIARRSGRLPGSRSCWRMVIHDR